MLDPGDLHSCFDAVPGAFFLITRDAEERIAFASKEALSLFQCASFEQLVELTGGNFQGMTPDAPTRSLADFVFRRNDADYAFLATAIRTSSGSSVQVEGSVKETSFKGVEYWALVLMDARARAAGIGGDTLTGLMGIHEFFDEVSSTVEHDAASGAVGSRCSIFVNITNFKTYNRVHGVEAGDACLRVVASELCAHFPHAIIAHMAADSFVLYLDHESEVFERVEAACRDIDEFLGSPSIRAKAGVFIDDTPALAAVELQETFDLAKIACDSIKGDAEAFCAKYTEQMGRRLEVRTRILETFDAALEDGRIKVFAQPLVRTFTGKICAVEMLARWDTPRGERLRPDEFISVLEDARLIHKLDLHVIDSVVHMLRDSIDAGRRIVPVSINISRVDFDLIDVFESVDRAARMLEIPREYLRIEVTETAIAGDDGKIRDAIARFRSHGYHVWIDDFGSGVSSLNVLKDYAVDGLKVDLEFMRNFNERSRTIVTSIARMAKGLGVHTIVEGVETQEQADFLKSTGCEIAQGFLYGKPAVASAVPARAKRLGMEAESPRERQVYSKSGLVDTAVDTPVATAYFQDGEIAILYANEAYRRTLASVGYSDEQAANAVLTACNYPIRDKFLTCINKSLASGAREMMTFVERGQYLRIFIEPVGDVGDAHILRFELYNITHDADRESSQHFDQLVRSVVLAYDAIYCLHVSSDEVEVIETLDSRVRPGERLSGIEEVLSGMAREYVFDEDLPRFLSFVKVENLYALAEESKRLEAMNLFRMRRLNGSYRWTVLDALVISHDPRADILLCLRDDVMERRRDLGSLLPVFASSFGMPLGNGGNVDDLRANLWQSYADFSKVPVFWKDRKRRYIGANRAYLDAFDISSVDAIKGRLDEEMGWSIDVARQRAGESAVLEEGRAVRDDASLCLMGGEVRTVLFTEYPVYRGGRIIGLEGTFRVLEEVEMQQGSDKDALLANHESGLPGYRAMVLAGLQFSENYRVSAEPYLMALIDVPEFDQVCAHCGRTFRRDLLMHVWERVCELRASGGTVAHIGSCVFAYLQKGSDVEELRRRVLAVAAEIHAIVEVDGCSCTLFPRVAVGASSEVQGFDRLLHLVDERLHEAESQPRSKGLLTGDCLLFSREQFDDIDACVAMWDPDTHEVLYMNKTYLRDLRLPESYSYAGAKCYELLEGNQAPCAGCRISQIARGGSGRLHHNPVAEKSYYARDMLVPWCGKDRIFSMAVDLSPYAENEKERNEFLYREASVNDAIAAGLQEIDPSEGIRKFIEHVGQNLEADRFYVFEENGEGTVGATFEWQRSGMDSLLRELQSISLGEVRSLLEEFKKIPVLLIEDVEAFVCEHEGAVVHVAGAKSVLAGHLRLSNGLSGFSLIVNPSPETFRTASLLLTTLTRFLEILLRNRDFVDHLSEISITDQLTGVMNRRSLAARLEDIPAGRSVAFVFADVNGLKTVNDEQGHVEGDRLIQLIARAMSDLVGPDHVFRMGGDEFLMVIENADSLDVDRVVARLREEIDRRGASAAMGWARYTTPIENIDAVISTIDRLMYEDKKQHYYGRRSTDR